MQTRIHHLPTLYGHLVGHQTGTTQLIIGIVSSLLMVQLAGQHDRRSLASVLPA